MVVLPSTENCGCIRVTGILNLSVPSGNCLYPPPPALFVYCISKMFTVDLKRDLSLCDFCVITSALYADL